jgi:hypothetical protein
MDTLITPRLHPAWKDGWRNLVLRWRHGRGRPSNPAFLPRHPTDAEAAQARHRELMQQAGLEAQPPVPFDPRTVKADCWIRNLLALAAVLVGLITLWVWAWRWV